MGSPFVLTAIHSEEETARQGIEAAFSEIDRIEALISSWQEDSATNALNRSAGQGPAPAPQELLLLLGRSLKVSELTGGAFDVTFASAGRLWDFQRPGAESKKPELPDPEAVRRSVENVDFRLVRLDNAAGTVEIQRPGTRIGFGGIGKGYAANRAVQAMKEAGVVGGLVNAGGDLLAFGRQEDGSPWTVAIADPLHPEKIFAYLELTDRAVATSGDYQRFFEIDGVRYAHILDPRTGYPVRGMRSATVLCPDAELADALATATFVMGPEEGIRLVDQLRGVEALLVDESGQLHFSKNLDSQLHRSSAKP